MRTSTGPSVASGIAAGQRVLSGIGRSHDVPRQQRLVTATPRPRRGRTVLRAVVPAAPVAAAFGFALPHLASYHSVWASVKAMTRPLALLVGAAAFLVWRHAPALIHTSPGSAGPESLRRDDDTVGPAANVPSG